jgi:hypothetical protein
LESAVVGLALVDQQTPLCVTVAPPSAVTFPPPVAAVGAMDDIAVVVTVGAETAISSAPMLRVEK